MNMTSNNPDIVVYTDGGARGNPGPSAVGVVIKEGEKTVQEIFHKIGRQTNNFAEYEAVSVALSAIKKRYAKNTKTMHIEVRLDSELIEKQLNNEYQIKEETLFPQYIKVHNLIVSAFPHISFVHIRREKNKRADELVNKALDG
jgi:ribonuclease HI